MSTMLAHGNIPFENISDPDLKRIVMLINENFASVEKGVRAATSSSVGGSGSSSAKTVVGAIYPVGSIYIGTTEECPIASIVGTWEKIEGRYILASGTLVGTNEEYDVEDSVDAGIPNITGFVDMNIITGMNSNGAFFNSGISERYYHFPNIGEPGYGILSKASFDASRSSAKYGASTTVRPAAYVVNVWKRTA